MNTPDIDINPARKENETFKEYKRRRAMVKWLLKQSKYVVTGTENNRSKRRNKNN